MHSAIGSLLGAIAFVTPQAAFGEPPLFAHAPGQPGSAVLNSALDLELKLRVDGGRLAELLLQAGADADDAVAAEKLLAADLEAGASRCYADVSISKPAGTEGWKIHRLTLVTDSSRTIVERRHGELTISATGPRRSPLA